MNYEIIIWTIFYTLSQFKQIFQTARSARSVTFDPLSPFGTLKWMHNEKQKDRCPIKVCLLLNVSLHTKSLNGEMIKDGSSILNGCSTCAFTITKLLIINHEKWVLHLCSEIRIALQKNKNYFYLKIGVEQVGGHTIQWG